MNNSSFPEEVETKPDLVERSGKLTTLIESANALLDSKEWSTLKEEFDLDRLDRVLSNEAKRPVLNDPEMYRLQGRIEQAKRYDLEHMRDKWLAELETIRKIA